jgi:hypothetical protein
MASSYPSNEPGPSSNPFAALQCNPKWRELEGLAATSSLSDRQVQDAFELLCENTTRSLSIRNPKSDALTWLQCDSEWGKLLCNAGSAVVQTKMDIDAAFRLLQERHRRTPTPRPPPPPISSPSQSEHEATGVEPSCFSGSSYAPPNRFPTRPANFEAHSSSDEIIPGRCREADNLYELGMNNNAFSNALSSPILSPRLYSCQSCTMGLCNTRTRLPQRWYMDHARCHEFLPIGSLVDHSAHLRILFPRHVIHT